MITQQDLLAQLFSTFDESAVGPFREFLANAEGVTKWQIAADFCLHDKDRPNNVYAFSLIPYDAYPNELSQEIRQNVPKDLKKTRDIPAKTIEFLRSPRFFHFAFVLTDSPAVFSNGTDSPSSLHVARESINLTVASLAGREGNSGPLRRFKMLQQDSKSKSFNVELLADMYVLSYFLCFVSLILAREVKTEVIGWFADRDNMTTWCEGVLWDFAAENLRGLSEHFQIAVPKGSPAVALPTPDLQPNLAMWYDEYVRIPDYFAGILSSWNLEENLIPGDKPKYSLLARELIADSENTAIFRVRYEIAGAQISRLVFSLSQGDEIAEDGA